MLKLRILEPDGVIKGLFTDYMLHEKLFSHQENICHMENR